MKSVCDQTHTRAKPLCEGSCEHTLNPIVRSSVSVILSKDTHTRVMCVWFLFEFAHGCDSEFVCVCPISAEADVNLMDNDK